MTRPLSLRASVATVTGALLIAAAVLATAVLAGAPFGVTVGSALLLLLAAVLAPLWLASRLTRSLRSATRTAVALSEGLEAPVPSTGLVEVDELGRALAASAQELRKRRDEAQKSEHLYIGLAESLPAMVWVIAKDGQTMFQNRRATEYTGRTLLEDRDARASIVHPDDQEYLLGKRRTALRDWREYHMEVRMRRHDGAYRWHKVTSAPISDLVGVQGQENWVSTATDIEGLKEAEELQNHLNTELERRVVEATQKLREETLVRQKAERQLRQTQKMEAISRLTGGIAHDLNNKLMVISANIDAVTKHVRDQPQLRRKLIAALVAADQASALMSKLLAFARQRDLQAQYIDIAEHLDSITSLLDRSFLSSSVEVRLSIPEDLWSVEVDPHELETAVVNLAVNSRDAMPEGGTISIEARNVHVRKGSLNDPDLGGDFVQILISDTGHGIAPDNLEHVFEPFFTTKEATQASGLGLSQVHGFARQLGGTVEITSSVGEGTSVALYLPRAALPARIGAKQELDDVMEDEEDQAGAAEILVVDDEVEVALALQGMLQERGYAVRTAIGADEALEAMRARRPHLVLTDVTMPGAVDGVALARRIRQADSGLPIVLITGNPMVVADSIEFPLLQKPIVSRDLHTAIQRYLAPAEDGKVVSLFADRGRRGA
jgi:PAS domain S-box-containing protein